MHFHIKAVKAGQSPTWLLLEAESLLAATQVVENKGYVVLASKSRLQPRLRGYARQPFSLLLFCQEFYTLFEAGLSVIEVLSLLHEKAPHGTAQQVLSQLAEAVREGQALSQAMRAQPQIFPGLFVATIQAAETTGDVAEAIQRYALYLESVDGLKKKIISAVLYPGIVLAVGITVSMFLLMFVIPKFSHIYKTQVKQVSFSTQCLMWLGDFSQRNTLWIGLGGVACIILFILVWRLPHWRSRVSDLAWRLPYLGEMMRIYTLSRFYRTFAMLLKSGIPVVTGMAMVDDLLGARLKNALGRARQLVVEGQPFTHALQVTDLTTAVSLRLFNVGEKTGNLHQMMEKAAAFHEEQMARWIDHLSKILEPTLMTLLGLFIGGIVLMMYLPIFELASGLD